MAARTTAPQLDARTRICVLHGSEDAIKQQHLAELKAALEKAHGEVETVTYDGSQDGLADVLDELRSVGLMQQHKLVIVDQAEDFVSSHRAVLERYAQQPSDTSTLVLRSQIWRAGKIDKLIGKVGCIIKCAPLPPVGRAKWLMQRARTVHQCHLDQAAATALVSRLGSDLMRLDSELAKLALMVANQQPITVDLIDQVVGRGSDEQAWAVQEALLQAMLDASRGRSSTSHLLAKIRDLVDLSRQPEVLVTYFLADMLRKLHLAQMMRLQNISPDQIASELKLWGPRKAMVMSTISALGPAAVSDAFEQIVRMDQRTKTGFGQAMRNLECLCVSLSSPPIQPPDPVFRMPSRLSSKMSSRPT